MSGRPWLAEEIRADLAAAVRRSRANGMPWKVLERVYGYSQATLKRLAAMDEGKNEPSFSAHETNEPSGVLSDAAHA